MTVKNHDGQSWCWGEAGQIQQWVSGVEMAVAGGDAVAGGCGCEQERCRFPDEI